MELFNDLVLHRVPILYGGSVVIWLSHRFRQSAGLFILLPVLLIVSTASIFLILVRTRHPIDFFELAAVLLYGVSLYVVVSELMIRKVSKLLTRTRGEKWTKELDYIYLTIGSVGILGALNRVDFLTGRVENADIIAPLILTTAVVVRFIKTRAEIEKWNKPEEQTTSGASGRS